MKLDITENRVLEIREVYNAIKLVTTKGEVMYINMRDSGFEFQYEGQKWQAKEGEVGMMKTSARGNVLVDQVGYAMDDIRNALADPDYRIGWQANIAMAFKDEMVKSSIHSPNPDNFSYLVTPDMLHKIANTAADNFLNLFQGSTTKVNLEEVSDLGHSTCDRITLKDFIRDCVETNTLIRLVYKIKGGYQLVQDKVQMEWEILNGEYVNNPFVGVTDILCYGDENIEALNIVIEKKESACCNNSGCNCHVANKGRD